MSTRNRRKREQKPSKRWREFIMFPRDAWVTMSERADYWWDVPAAHLAPNAMVWRLLDGPNDVERHAL